MIKRVEVMGIELDNYTVQEAIRQVETYLDSQVLNTVECISMQMLIDAQKDDVLKEMLGALSLTVIGEKQILQAMGVTDILRMREIRENNFLFEFLKRLERNKKSIFLLGQTVDTIEDRKTDLLQEFPKLVFVGEYAIDLCGGDAETIINEINAATPEIIISVISSPLQEHFLWQHKDKISANIWYGLGDFEIRRPKWGMKAFIQKKMQLKQLKNSMNDYERG